MYRYQNNIHDHSGTSFVHLKGPVLVTNASTKAPAFAVDRPSAGLVLSAVPEIISIPFYCISTIDDLE